MTQLSARRSATRERLMQAAMDAFAEHGVLGASVEEICERAGFTRGAFYSNFESKDELCIALLQAQAERSYELLIRGAEQLDQPDFVEPDDIHRNVHAILSIVLDQMDSEKSVLFSMEMRAYAVRTASVLPIYREQDRRFNEQFTELVDRLLERTGMKLRLPTRDAFPLLAGVCESAILNARIRGQEREAAVNDLTATVEVLLAARED